MSKWYESDHYNIDRTNCAVANETGPHRAIVEARNLGMGAVPAVAMSNAAPAIVVGAVDSIAG